MIDTASRIGSSLGLFGYYFPDKWKLRKLLENTPKGTVSSVPPTAEALSQEVNIGPQDIILAAAAHEPPKAAHASRAWTRMRIMYFEAPTK